MAATTSYHLAQLAVPRPWDQMQRPQSQPDSTSRHMRYSDRRLPSRVKTRPADPIVINSILDSFDTLTPSPVLASDEPRFDPESRPLRPYTADETIAGESSFPDHGFGVEYGTGLSMNDESGQSNAALPPTVRTSRDFSGVIYYKAAKTSNFFGTNGDGLARSSSQNSRRSFSFRRKDKERPGKYKLSSESWVKQGTTSQDSLQNEWSAGDDLGSLNRESSPESFRPPRSRIEPPPVMPVSPTLSRTEQHIALTSTPRSANSRRRIYLTDRDSTESHPVPDSTVILEAPEFEDSSFFPQRPIDHVEPTIDEHLEEHVNIATANRYDNDEQIPNRRSPEKSTIVDSIPMRTSSLRQSSSSPGPSKKKGRKSKRRSETARLASMRAGDQRDSIASDSSRDISDSTWNDLGDDDDTVRRIRELREKRYSRKLEPKESRARGKSPATASEISTSSTTDRKPSFGEDFKAGPSLRPEAIRKVREPSPLSQRVRRPGSEMSIPEFPGQFDERRIPNNRPPAIRHRPNRSLEESKPNIRPITSTSNAAFEPSLTLDYSYAAAVDALGQKQDSPLSPQFPTTPTSSAPPTKLSSPKGSPGNMRTKIFRWKTSPAEHPDIPLDFDSKAYRRSASVDLDVRKPAVQPDSVELAVNDYLRAKRLNYKIKHPLNGRTISFSEVGDPNGAAVLVCMGMGLTRYVSAFYDELAATLRLRLVTIDRPGIGNSEPYPPHDKSGPLGWPDDVLAVCQYLGIGSFSIIAQSAGAIYALATALILPHLIRGKVHLLSPWIPPSQLEAYAGRAACVSPGGGLPRSQRFLRMLPTPFLKAANSTFITANSTSMQPAHKLKPKHERRQSTPPSSSGGTSLTMEDRDEAQNRRASMMAMDQFMPDINPTDSIPVQDSTSSIRNGSFTTSVTPSRIHSNSEPASARLNRTERMEKRRKHEYATLLTQRTWELATKDSNPATDLIVCLESNREIGFRYTDVHHEVVITHGADDKRVPVGNVRWLAEQMNRHSMAFNTGAGPSDRLVTGGCQTRILQGEAHGLMASPLIMADILTEIAGYWDGR